MRVCGVAVAGVLSTLAVLGGAAGAAPQNPGATLPGVDGYVWTDVDGNPLPFQSDEEILAFLREARIESESTIELGITNPRRVVLERGGVRMNAALRDYDETFTEARIDGEFYPRLRDAYIFDLPAYEMSHLLGLNNIPPVTLRRIGGAEVSLQAWLEGAMMESDRITEGTNPPSAVRFRRQTQEMRVFDSVIGNVDRNTGNILHDENGNIWLIDHSRAFPRSDQTRYLEDISACSRQLYERLQEITHDDLMPLLSSSLTESEVEWVLRRRDKVIAHIQALIAERTEGAVLFERDG